MKMTIESNIFDWRMQLIHRIFHSHSPLAPHPRNQRCSRREWDISRGAVIHREELPQALLVQALVQVMLRWGTARAYCYCCVVMYTTESAGTSPSAQYDLAHLTASLFFCILYVYLINLQ